jgi:glycosyltransferase involved in cell wall biosynthesis
MKQLRIAVVHDWLVNYSGAERVLEQILNIFPDADIYSTVDFLPDELRWYIKNKKAKTTFIQRMPFAKKKYRVYLPLMPFAIEQLDVTGYDIVISSSYAVAKGVITTVNQLHICYCHSPIRYAWDLYHQYLHESKLNRGFRGFFAKMILHYIRIWDFSTSARVDHFIANSSYVAKRIRKTYQREAVVIYPPVNITAFALEEKKGDYYLVASRMVPYKKIDLIVEAFSKMPEKKLIVVGDGPDYKKVKSKAAPNTIILGHVPHEDLRKYMAEAKAFIIAADEDFGITAVEAQACGTPVIAYAKGGVRDSVIENQTGVFFEEQTIESLSEAIVRFENLANLLPAAQIRNNALKFGIEEFKLHFKGFVDNCINQAK